MKALIIMAHGSRRQASNQEIAALTGRLREGMSEFDLFGHAFLELTTPGLDEATAELVTQGATSITILPYFLVAGRHVAVDIPDQVATLKAAYPDLRITLLDYFGMSTGIEQLLIDQIRRTSPPD